MFQRPQIKHPHTAIRPRTRKHVRRRCKCQVVHLLVVCDELRLGLVRLDVPYRAGGVDGRRADDGRVGLIPVERRQWCTKLTVLIIIQQTQHLDVVTTPAAANLPYPQIIPRRSQQVLPTTLLVRHEHYLGGGVRVEERADRRERAAVLVQLDELDLILVVFDERADGEAEFG